MMVEGMFIEHRPYVFTLFIEHRNFYTIVYVLKFKFKNVRFLESFEDSFSKLEHFLIDKLFEITLNRAYFKGKIFNNKKRRSINLYRSL